MADDLTAFGLEEEIAEVPVQDEAGERFEVWAENIETVRVFVQLETQWRTVGTFADMVRTGIDYAALPMVLDMQPDLPRKRWPEIYQGIRIMERAALATLRELREQQK